MPNLTRPISNGVIGGTLGSVLPHYLGWEWTLALVAGFVLAVGWARRDSDG